jgi:hypothetical protein
MFSRIKPRKPKMNLHHCEYLKSHILTKTKAFLFPQILCFWTLSIVLFLSKTLSCLYFKTQHFRDWILPLPSGKTYSLGPN